MAVTSRRKIIVEENVEASGRAPPAVVGPAPEPAEDDGVLHYKYPDGRWETLSIGETGVTLIGYSPEPMTDSRDVHGGAFLTTRGASHFVSMVGGGA